MTVIRLTEAHYKEAVHLSEYAFQNKVSAEEVERRKEHYKKYHELFGILDEQKLAAKLHLVPLEVYIGEQKYKMGGIAGVATYPEYRRKGYVKELLQHTLKTMKDEGYSMSMLHPFSVSFYRKYGWELYTDRLVYTLTKHDLMKHADVKGTVRRFQKETHHEDIELVYEQFAKRYEGMLVRSKDWWMHSVYDDLHAAIYYTKQNEPIGYILYEIKDYKMKVEEFVPLNREARSGLWNFICQHDSMLNEVEMIVHEKEPLPYTLQEPRIKAEKKPYFMARIVDVERFLQQYSFESGSEGTEVILHITDSFADWNNKTVICKNGEVVVLHEDEAKQLQDKGLHVNINTLSTMLLGYKRPLELYEIGAIVGEEEIVQQLESLIALRQPFLYDFF